MTSDKHSANVIKINSLLLVRGDAEYFHVIYTIFFLCIIPLRLLSVVALFFIYLSHPIIWP